MDQPTKVVYVLTSGPAQRSKETGLKVFESATPGSVTVEEKPMLPAADEEKSSTEKSVGEGSPKGEESQSALPAPSSSSPSDVVLDHSDESKENSESPDVDKELPVKETVPEDQQTEAE